VRLFSSQDPKEQWKIALDFLARRVDGEDGREKRRIEEQKKYREDFIASSGFAERSGAFLFQFSAKSCDIDHVKTEHQKVEAQLLCPALIS
jgi:hypothetical protein